MTVDGTTVHVGPDAFVVGEPDDRLEVGDWDCDGEATIALLRPGTGDVFVFPGWAVEDAVTVDPVVTVPDAAALVVSPTTPGCADLAVRTGAGTIVDVTRSGAAS